MTEDILDAARAAIRTTSDAYDGELEMLIGAARIAMAEHGVAGYKIDDTDPIVRLAICTYVRAHFGLDNADAERYGLVFADLCNLLHMTTDYGDDDAVG